MEFLTKNANRALIQRSMTVVFRIWSSDGTDLSLWRHWYCVCCHVIITSLILWLFAPLGNNHNINDVIMTSRSYHVTNSSSLLLDINDWTFFRYSTAAVSSLGPRFPHSDQWEDVCDDEKWRIVPMDGPGLSRFQDNTSGIHLQI